VFIEKLDELGEVGQSLLPHREFGPVSRIVMALHRLTYSRENRPVEAL
jgi:hypothetical protein